ncbi:hypothetical protein BDV93DRAFT_510868 [Ceratobasidium sp. AG-I]|nr:hypothetical protein BDV93DRAFT_510868 [Ceratobasidium sp. AG-I]
MSHDAKKRKISETSTAETSPESASDISLLRRVFNESHTPNLVHALNESLDTATPEEIQILKHLLEPLVTAATSPLHCVRCHQTYLESKNHDKACVIEHEELEYDHKGYKGAMIYKATCCSQEYEYELSTPFPPCYVAAHTIDPLEVRYYEEADDSEDENEEADDDDGDYPRNKNVRTCAQMQCGTK